MTTAAFLAFFEPFPVFLPCPSLSYLSSLVFSASGPGNHKQRKEHQESKHRNLEPGTFSSADARQCLDDISTKGTPPFRSHHMTCNSHPTQSRYSSYSSRRECLSRSRPIPAGFHCRCKNDTCLALCRCRCCSRFRPSRSSGGI